jgi:hypothetical protein
MDSSKLAFKFFLADGSHFEQEVIVPVFHTWIQKHTMEGHLLIDVAEYKHVENGPGTVLVAHEGNFSTDMAIGGGPGLLYMRKQPLEGDLVARIRQVLKISLVATAAMEGEEKLAGKVRFRTDNPLFRIYDRLEAPNAAVTFEVIQGALQAVLEGVYGSSVKLTFHPDAQGVFEVRIAGAAIEVSNLLARI